MPLALLPFVALLVAVPPGPAQAHYKAKEYEAAAISFAQSAPDPRARFGLARSLYHLGFLASARSLFIEIARQTPPDPFRRRALPWLASLARDLEPDAELLATIGSYGPSDLEDGAFEDVRDDLYFMLGRAQYDRGALDLAVASLSEVGTNAIDYTRAQYLTGVANTRLWKGTEAVAAFKNVLRRQADLRGDLGPKQLRRAARWTRRRARLQRKRRDKALSRLESRVERKGMSFAELDELKQTQHHEQMASLAMAYVFYQTGQLGLANKYFNRIPKESPYWLDAIFGKAWTEFLAAYRDTDNENLHYQRALGHIHTLRAPFFPYRLYPEIPLLEAEIFYFNCRYQLAAAAIDDFDARYGSVGEDLRRLLADHPADFDLYALDKRVQDNKSPVDEGTTRVLEGLLDNKRLDQHRAMVERLEAEVSRLERTTDAFRNGVAGERVAEDIDLAVSAAREAAGKAIRQRLEVAVREIKRFKRNAIKIEYELEPKLVAVPGAGKPEQRAKPGNEHERYKYNGEYWQDELGHYNYKVTSKCK